MSSPTVVGSDPPIYNNDEDGLPTDPPGDEEIKGNVRTKLENGKQDDIDPIKTNSPDGKEEVETEDQLRRSSRNRHQTPKGKQFQLNNHIAFMKSSKKRLQKQASLIKTLLTGSNRDMVTNELNTLEKTYGEFAEDYARACAILGEMSEANEEDEDIQDTVSILMEEVDSSYLSVKENVCSWMIELEKREAPPASVKSGKSGAKGKPKRSKAASVHGSVKSARSTNSKNPPSIAGSDKSGGSTRSSRSSCTGSHCSDLSLRQKAKLAGLKAKAESLKKVKEAELNVEMSRLEMEIKKAEAEEKVYEEEAQKELVSNHLPEEDQLVTRVAKENTSSKPHPKDTLTSDTLHTSSSDTQTALLDMIKLHSAPKPDLDTFSGDPLEYLYFKANFKEVVESVVQDQRGRLTRLIKYTDGEPKDMIKHLVHADPHTCYSTAISLLDKEYGNPHILSCSYLKELRLWNPIKENDIAAFKKFHRFLLKCQTYKLDGRLGELDSTDMIRVVISKVHASHQGRWLRKALDIRRKHKKEADFDDLVKFFGREAEVLSDPAYSREALADSNSITTFSTLVTSRDVTFVECPLCKSAHDLEDCEQYLTMDIDKRHKTIFQLRLCFGCLEPVDKDHGHVSKSCANRRKCRVCQEEHPTTLHGGNGGKTFSTHVKGSSRAISMCVVPVLLRHRSRPEHQITVYALLDECSTGTFISEKALELLDIPDNKLSLTSCDVTTIIGRSEDQVVGVKNLIVKCTSLHSELYPSLDVDLPETFSRSILSVDREEIPTPSRIRKWPHLQRLMDKIPEFDPSFPIGLIIGGDCPRALEPLEAVESTLDGPYGKRTRLGWCVIGPVEPASSDKQSLHCYSTRATIPVRDISTGAIANHCFASKEDVQDNHINRCLKEMYTMEFNEVDSEKQALSQEDEEFMEKMRNGASKKGQKHVLPLPFRNTNVSLPDNRHMVKNRLGALKRKLARDKEHHRRYSELMQWLISNYAQKADTSKDQKGRIWHIPHHGVYNAQKGKLRIVFDASAKFDGRSLNQELLQGPDMTNLLVGVLLRFRKEKVAIMADIEAMFYQVLIPESQRSFFRFFWWLDGNLDAELTEYEMCVHLFGAVSSGGAANYALRQTADDCEPQLGAEVAYTIRRNFYVDDMLKSLSEVSAAKELVAAVQAGCASGGFNLTKVVSNSREVLNSVPVEHRAPSVANLDLCLDRLPVERALGTQWCVEDDTLGFRIEFKDSPLSRKGILGTISSCYDPNGLVGPFLLPGRKVLQRITQHGGSWDDPVPENLRTDWEKWRADLPALQELRIPRCYKPAGFKATSWSLHCFSDASDYGYGMAAYLRQVSESGEVAVSLVMAKSRVVPADAPTVPRLELTAALISAKVAALLLDELDMESLTVVFWVDNTIVLGYIHNRTKRFRVYVANRSRKIRKISESWPWKHVTTDNNPADDASRGLSVQDVAKVERWFNGPSFLKDQMESFVAESDLYDVPDDDPEVVAQVKSHATRVAKKDHQDIITILSERISNWSRMKRTLATAVAYCERSRCRRSRVLPISVEDVLAAENLIIKWVQQIHFTEDLEALKGGKTVKKSSRLCQLDPFLDKNGILRVGGRLRKSPLPMENKHPAILPRKDPIVTRLIQWYHKNIQHLGRTSTVGELRSRGYWLMSANEQVRRVVSRCVPCKILRGQLAEQKMADLPETRANEAPPFTYCGCDCFGHFIVKERRTEMKRYGVVFTCLGCRAIHLEVVTNMDTDSFILALRRFIGRRGPVRYIKSDNGGNFVGADNEMAKAMKAMDQGKVRDALAENSCDWDWVEWERNPAVASHMGGVWERQIRTIRNILSSLLMEHASRLNDESLRTLFIEVEAIVNSRPLCYDTLSDESTEPLTPNHLLTMKTKVVLPPPGVFQRADVYCRKRWRAVQYMANEFWTRWRKEYLLNLQQRQKWTTVRPNLGVDDVVLVADLDCPRNQWPLGRIVEAHPSDDGLVRKVSVKLANSDAPLSRPVAKLVLLLKNSIEG